MDPNENESEFVAIRAELNRLNSRLRMSLPKVMGIQFLRGIAFGLGSVLGATLVVSVVVYSLSSINFIPIIGDWAAQIVERIQVK